MYVVGELEADALFIAEEARTVLLACVERYAPREADAVARGCLVEHLVQVAQEALHLVHSLRM